ncbi:MAG: VOC family protein [Proteobacteria bacterium]|nr:VOC family protein [Pseudomonadota bacterium]
MSKKFKPDNMPTLSPYLAVLDAQRSLDFYQKAFGFKLHSEPMRDESGKIGHCEMEFHGAFIMFSPESNWGSYASTVKMVAPKTIGTSRSAALYVYCPDVDALYNQAIAAGAKSIAEPQDAFWGDRYCSVEDIDGYIWSFGTILAN